MTTASQHEELDRAAEAVKEMTEDPTEALEIPEEQVEEQAVESPQEDSQTKQRDEENAERSRLGRKVKELEEQLAGVTEMRGQLDRLASLLENREEENDEEEILTSKTFENYLKSYEQKKNSEKQNYEKSYTTAFAKIGADDDDFNDVWEEMVANHNVVHTGSPDTDARINYLAAQNALLKKPNNPLQGKGKTVEGVNVPNSSKTTTKKSMPKLDPVAEEFVRRQKLSPEFVNKVLNPDG